MLEHRPFLATNWKILSIVAFAVVNCIVKALSSGADTLVGSFSTLPVAELIFFQYLISSLLIYPLIHTRKTLIPKKNITLHILRVGFAILGIFCWAEGIKLLPLGQCVALSFLSPIFTVVGAWFLLKEPLTVTRILAISASFIGALIITNPFVELSQVQFNWACFCPIIGSVCFASDKILNRMLSGKGDHALDLTFILIVGVAPVSLFFALPTWTPVATSHIPLLLLMGAASGFANFAMIKSCALADISYVTPVGLVKFIINVLVGALFFMEYSANYSLWVGTSFVLLSVLMLTKEGRTNPEPLKN